MLGEEEEGEDGEGLAAASNLIRHSATIEKQLSMQKKKLWGHRSNKH